MPYLVEIIGDDGRTDRQLIEEKSSLKIAIFPPSLLCLRIHRFGLRTGDLRAWSLAFCMKCQRSK
jgi:hypothetical protein